MNHLGSIARLAATCQNIFSFSANQMEKVEVRHVSCVNVGMSASSYEQREKLALATFCVDNSDHDRLINIACKRLLLHVQLKLLIKSVNHETLLDFDTLQLDNFMKICMRIYFPLSHYQQYNVHRAHMT